MSATPRTDELVFEIRHMPNTGEMYNRMRDFARELERENTHLLVLATNAEFNASKAERENARLRELLTEALAMAEAWEDFEGSPATDFVMRLRSELPNAKDEPTRGQTS